MWCILCFFCFNVIGSDCDELIEESIDIKVEFDKDDCLMEIIDSSRVIGSVLSMGIDELLEIKVLTLILFNRLRFIAVIKQLEMESQDSIHCY